MQHEFILKVITQGIVGLIFLALLLVLLFTHRKEIQGRRRLNGIVFFAVAILGLWCFLAFAEMYVSVRKIIAHQCTPERTGH